MSQRAPVPPGAKSKAALHPLGPAVVIRRDQVGSFIRQNLPYQRYLWPFVTLMLVFFGGVGCADHAQRLAKVRTALDAGRSGEALELLNRELEVKSPEELPKDTRESSLLLLDRAMILQEVDAYELSSRDLQVADKEIQLLDFSRNTLDEIGKYLYSDDTGPYQAPPYEKLLINTINMQNYLVRRDLSGARVEARRLAVMQNYFRQGEEAGHALLGPGSYLAGFVFEKSGRYDEALRYYDEALAYADYRTLDEPILRLLGLGSYTTPRLRRAAQRAQEHGATAPEASAAQADPEAPGEILILFNYGRVPPKVAKRVPIGLALTYASGALSPADQARANALAAQGLVTWVNYPELGEAQGQYDTPSAAVNGQGARVEQLSAVDYETRKAWERVRGPIVASAITRMLTRVVVGEGVRRTNDGLVGLLLSLGTQAALTAADTPDTRSWSTLPARIAVARVRVKPGRHRLTLTSRGRAEVVEVEVSPGGWAAVVVTALR